MMNIPMPSGDVRSPCMKCDQRSPECHGVCNRYAEYRAEVDEVNNRYRAEQEKIHFGARLNWHKK